MAGSVFAAAKKKQVKVTPKKYQAPKFDSAYFVEETYPFVTAADWRAVASAYQQAGKSALAESAIAFAKRLEERAKQQNQAGEKAGQ